MVGGINITDRAAKRIKELLAAGNKKGYGLRVRVVGGGCSGLQYKVNLDVERTGDRIFEKDAAKVLIDPKSFLYLNGTELDYREELIGSAFIFQNTNVEGACGCGASFTVYPDAPYVPNIW